MTYTRRVANAERLFSLSPFSVVTVVARVNGSVTEGMLRSAVDAARRRHPLLNARIVMDEMGDPWFTTEGAGAIPILVVERQADDQWLGVMVRERQVPFDFDTMPPIHLVLIRSASRSDILIMCHHIICDGMSLAYLARDLLAFMADPERSVGDVLPPVPVDADSLPEHVSLNGLAKRLIGRINAKWQAEAVRFEEQDYLGLCEAYWQHFDHRCLAIEFGEQETSDLVARCRRHGVTVNSALAAACAGAQALVLGTRACNTKLAVAASLRGRLAKDVGEAMAFYAGAPILNCRYRSDKGFWENARRFHKAIRSRLDDKHVLQDLVNWSHLDPTILEAVNFKKLGHLVESGQPSQPKLADFAQRDDVVTRILKRDGQLDLDRITVGTAITNLTRLDFPAHYGPYNLDRMIMVPGGAFPLVNCGLVLGAVTCADKLSLTIEYAEQAVSTQNMERIRDQALDLMSRDQ